MLFWKRGKDKTKKKANRCLWVPFVWKPTHCTANFSQIPTACNIPPQFCSYLSLTVLHPWWSYKCKAVHKQCASTFIMQYVTTTTQTRATIKQKTAHKLKHTDQHTQHAEKAQSLQPVCNRNQSECAIVSTDSLKTNHLRTDLCLRAQ